VNIAGTGITAFDCRVLAGFKPLTNLAIVWHQLASGNWRAGDRGAASDRYESQISIYGPETTINNFINQIYAGRVNGNNQITLSTFADDEKIFGENVDHSGSITATILEMPQRAQASLTGWGISDIYLRAIIDATDNENFTGTNTMPTLKYIETTGTADADYSIKKMDSFTGALSYLDHGSDSGIFEAVFTLSNADFIKMRNYIRVTRSGDMTLADTFGATYPFGPRSSGSYSFTVKLIDWEDLGFYGPLHNKIRLRFAEAV
jgi:hypothetical protein